MMWVGQAASHAVGVWVNQADSMLWVGQAGPHAVSGPGITTCCGWVRRDHMLWVSQADRMLWVCEVGPNSVGGRHHMLCVSQAGLPTVGEPGEPHAVGGPDTMTECGWERSADFLHRSVSHETNQE